MSSRAFDAIWNASAMASALEPRLLQRRHQLRAGVDQFPHLLGETLRRLLRTAAAATARRQPGCRSRPCWPAAAATGAAMRSGTAAAPAVVTVSPWPSGCHAPAKPALATWLCRPAMFADAVPAAPVARPASRAGTDSSWNPARGSPISGPARPASASPRPAEADFPSSPRARQAPPLHQAAEPPPATPQPQHPADQALRRRAARAPTGTPPHR